MISLSLIEKSPSGPIKIHNGSSLLISIFLFFELRSPKRIVISIFSFKNSSRFFNLSRVGKFNLLLCSDASTIIFLILFETC